MLTHPELTVHILCMLMHVSSGHMTLLPGEFHPPPLEFPSQLDLGRRVDSRWSLPQFLVCISTI